jgi:hypothetical protein
MLRGMTRAGLSIAVSVAAVVLVSAAPDVARADDVFEVCKGESKTVVTGKGKMSIAVVYPENFPVTTTPKSRNAVGARLARQEKAKIVPAKDVFAAQALVKEKRWSAKVEACGVAPSLIAVLGQKHTNLATANADVACDDKGACTLHLDLQRHGKGSADRWVRYSAVLDGPKDQLDTYIRAAGKLTPGELPNHSMKGLAVKELPLGVVTARSDVDGALEVDAAMEANAAFAACRPKSRKAHDMRGYYAEWTLTALGRPSGVSVKQFQGTDASDAEVAECLQSALEKSQLACPRDSKPAKVKTAICL